MATVAPEPDRYQTSLFDILELPPTQLLTPDEIFDRVDAALLEQLDEDKRVERKPASYPGDALGDYISMWANTAPHGGIIVVGMEDKRAGGRFEGLMSRSQEGINKLETAPHTYCPEARCEIKRVAVINKAGQRDYVLVYRVHYHQSRVVKTVKGNVFVRRGDEKHKLSPEEVRQLQADKNEISFESEPCRLEYPGEFDTSAIQRFCARVRDSKAWEADQHPDDDVLSLMHLGKRKPDGFEPNIACALLFARDPVAVVPGCKVRFLRFDSDEEGSGERWNAVKDELIEGTVPQLIAETERVLLSQLRTFSRLAPSDKFLTLPEYPKTAWYEAIVNACVHRSYGNGLKNRPIFVKMFDSRLEIESPGPFPPFVTPENIQESHHPKNPFLMEAMRHLDFVKCAHEGTRRMVISMRDMRLPAPEFRQEEIGIHTVKVTLRNNVHQRKTWVVRDVAELIGSIMAKALSEDQRRLVNLISERGEISVADAQRLIGGDWATVKKKLMKLVGMGILKRDARSELDRDPKARFKLSNAPDAGG